MWAMPEIFSNSWWPQIPYVHSQWILATPMSYLWSRIQQSDQLEKSPLFTYRYLLTYFNALNLCPIPVIIFLNIMKQNLKKFCQKIWEWFFSKFNFSKFKERKSQNWIQQPIACYFDAYLVYRSHLSGQYLLRYEVSKTSFQYVFMELYNIFPRNSQKWW